MLTSDTSLLITLPVHHRLPGGVATLLQTLGIPFFGSRLPLVQRRVVRRH